ncbi:MAG: hypothetical protein NC548_25275 [Lachnospiraceae bacterium]|nr:hypothetical protein [Lachnospiraceae bacterium]
MKFKGDRFPDKEGKADVSEVDEAFEGVSEASGSTGGNVDAEPDEALDEVFEGVLPEAAGTSEPVPQETQMFALADEDMSHLDVGTAETDYKDAEFNREAAPIITATVNTEVRKAVKLNNERLKMEVNEVLADEVGYRLDKYEKRRRSRQRKDFIGSVVRWIVVGGIVLLIFGNAQLRLRMQIIFQDAGELVASLIHGEEVSSNQLVEDMFRDLGDDLNEVNTYEEGGAGNE